VLRALALVRVVTFHTFGWLWLPILFPSMGIMFALGGRLVASSLDSARSPRSFYRKRIQRLLPPLWAYGLIVVPLMFGLGWAANTDGSNSFTWSTAWMWVFPLSDPPGSAAGVDWVVPLWYIRTYLWLILLSPALLWLFRRWPLRVAAVPVILMGLLASGLLNLDGSRAYDILNELSIFTCCWLAGFAHYDGAFHRAKASRFLLVGALLMTLGLWFAFAHRESFGSYNPDDIPLTDMLYSLGAVLILLCFYPQLTWLRRFPTLEACIGLVNSRAMTIYLWNNFAIWLAPLALERLGLGQLDTADLRGQVLEFATVWLLIGAAILLVGWVEDVAAGRRARLLPWTRVPRPQRPRVSVPRRVVFEGNEVRLELAGVPEPGLPDRQAVDEVIRDKVPEVKASVQFRNNVVSLDGGETRLDSEQVWHGDEVRLEDCDVPPENGSEAEEVVRFRDNRVRSADPGGSVHESDHPA
jgi:peptidoglycan/LPS O-acetylase OafA/YrhL